MSKLAIQRAELKSIGASKKIQKRFAPAVRRWDQKMMNFKIHKMMEVHAATANLV